MAHPSIVACASCGGKNRVPPERFKDGPVCGKCKASLPLGGAPMDVDEGNFEGAVLQAPLPVVLDFWAPWCGPCKVVGPVLETIARERAGRVLVGKCNVDNNPSLAARFGVQGVPTLVVFKDGREADRRVGAVPKAGLEAMIDGV